MKPEATPKMMVLSSPIGLRSFLNSLVAFSIIVSSVTFLFHQGQEGQVPKAIKPSLSLAFSFVSHTDSFVRNFEIAPSIQFRQELNRPLHSVSSGTLKSARCSTLSPDSSV
ncbi:hypothetical protein SETIT_7G331400v2 [Setaria italica]|uniref:Uncharacterized protein n=2 Tax=Setaria TaxID=4554 RepID=A0A368S448_SETIT|nr:hypothetical protein SETIT_7G331400v2 [Setaria italica]TKW07937.1 hypothetical protein SEVIR_7G340400v2 [Setaria viridis]